MGVRQYNFNLYKFHTVTLTAQIQIEIEIQAWSVIKEHWALAVPCFIAICTSLQWYLVRCYSIDRGISKIITRHDFLVRSSQIAVVSTLSQGVQNVCTLTLRPNVDLMKMDPHSLIQKLQVQGRTLSWLRLGRGGFRRSCHQSGPVTCQCDTPKFRLL